MENNTYIMQKWFHIHEFYNENKLIREIKEVLDVYTKENFVCYEFTLEHVAHIQVTNYIMKINYLSSIPIKRLKYLWIQ